MPRELGHEALAEVHDLDVRLALGVEVGAALAAAHGKPGQAVLEGLLEGQELQDAEVHAGMKADAALVRTDRVAVLHAVAAVDLNFAFVVLPGHAKHDHAVGFRQARENVCFRVLGMFEQERQDVDADLVDGLVKLLLAGIALPEPGHECVDNFIVRHAGSEIDHRSVLLFKL